jgi:hypothetical protein
VSLIHTAKRNHIKKLADSLTSDNTIQKDWWRVIKSFISPTEKQIIPALTCPDSNRLIFDNKSKSVILNKFFCSQSSLDNSNKETPEDFYVQPVRTLTSITVTPQDVEDAINTLNINKASGPDEISNRLLCETASVTKYPLCSLFNHSLRCCKVPQSWKDANVCPIFKKGDPSMPNNYRPISLLCCMEKVFERILFKYIFTFLHENDFISPLQSGFKPGDSTMNQLTFL